MKKRLFFVVSIETNEDE